MTNKQKSDCCGAKVRAVGNTTKFYGCTACGEPCNLAHLGDTTDMVDHTEDSHDMVEEKMKEYEGNRDKITAILKYYLSNDLRDTPHDLILSLEKLTKDLLEAKDAEWQTHFDEMEARWREEHGLTTKELRLLIALVEGEKAGASLMQGFRLPTEREQDTNAYYDKIIVKLEKLINKK